MRKCCVEDIAGNGWEWLQGFFEQRSIGLFCCFNESQQLAVLTTVLGQRLAHWGLAWRMGLDRPWTGWGRYGYEAEKQRRVDAGETHPIVLQFSHAHNELLDIFAKRGIPGVVVLLIFYGVPLVLFWPTRRRVFPGAAGVLDAEGLCLRMIGVLLPVSYMGFGTTQVFLGHNSGTMFYLFMGMLVLAILQGRERLRLQTPGQAASLS